MRKSGFQRCKRDLPMHCAKPSRMPAFDPTTRELSSSSCMYATVPRGPPSHKPSTERPLVVLQSWNIRPLRHLSKCSVLKVHQLREMRPNLLVNHLLLRLQDIWHDKNQVSTQPKNKFEADPWGHPTDHFESYESLDRGLLTAPQYGVLHAEGSVVQECGNIFDCLD